MTDTVLTRRYKVGSAWPPLIGQLTDADGLPVDLSAATARFQARPVDGTPGTFTIDAAAEVLLPETDGRVRYTWAPTDLNAVGHYLAWFRLSMPPTGAIGFAPHDQADAGAEAAIDIFVEPL